MAEDYETKQSDVRAPSGNEGADRPVVDDPLLELARIVQKNKQVGSRVSSGRVGATDYFAGLEDVAETASESAPETTSTPRVEPSFAYSPASGRDRETDSRPEPAPVRLAPFQPSSAGTAQEQETHTSPERPLDTDIRPAGRDTAPGRFEERSTHVSSLWPKGPAEFQPAEERGRAVEATLPEPETHEPLAFEYEEARPRYREQVVAEPESLERDLYEAAPEPGPFERPDVSLEDFEEISGEAEDVTAGTSLAPSLSLDLEQNLTAELEDELIGALRQSVDEQTEVRVAPPVQPEEPRAPATFAPRFDLPSLRAGDQGLEAETETPPEPVVETPSAEDLRIFDDRTDKRVLAERGRTSVAAPFSLEPEARTETVKVHPPQPDSRRPSIDENDFLAALNTPSTAVASQGGEDRKSVV